MNTKKIMAVMVVLMMAASSIALLQFADEPVADQNDTMPGVSDLKVGETLGFKVSEQMNMTEALSKAAPAIKELLDEMASSMGTTTKDLNVNVEPEKKCPISANMMIIITMVIAFLVVIATLAISSRKNKP